MSHNMTVSTGVTGQFPEREVIEGQGKNMMFMTVQSRKNRFDGTAAGRP
jgi:hypothetical protein